MLNQVDYSRKWYVMTAVGLSLFLETIDTSIVNMALPTLVRTFATDLATVQWVILAFVLTQATLMLSIGRLGDMWGKKPIFVAGFAVTGIGAILCGLAPSIGWLIAFRVVEAAGVAMALALSLGIATEAFPPNERGKALGLVSGIVSVGVIVGPLLGGVILESLSWRWIFFCNAPMAIIGLPVAWRNMPNVRPPGGQRFDFAGATAFFVVLLGFLLAMTYGQRSGYGAPSVLLLFGLAALFLVIFLLIQMRTAHPVIDLQLFHHRIFSLNLFLRLISFIVYAGVSLILPFYLEDILGVSPRQSGYLLTAMPVAFGIAGMISGVLADRIGNRPVALFGLAALLVGFVTASTLTAQTGVVGYVLRLIPIGLGMGTFQSPNNSVIFGAAPPTRLGMASSLLSVVRTLGRSTGIALIGATWSGLVLFYARGQTSNLTQAPMSAQVAGLQGAFWVMAALVLVALLLSLWDWQQERQGRAAGMVVTG